MAATTADTAQLKTWWHDNHELNSTTPVADDAVRRSTFYDVQVSTTSEPATLYDSYTYMSLPRGGRDKWLYTEDDGAEFADAANLTMSWSSFVYDTDVWVEVSLRDGSTFQSIDEVTIRPVSLGFEKVQVDADTVRIKVPYSSNGYRFSVEFNSQLYTAYNDLSGVSGQLNDAGNGRAIHTEPRNAMLIFAEPRLDGPEAARLIPSESDGTIYYPQPGEVSNLDTITEEIVYFGPGTYYMPWNYHAILPANVKWVYLAPGAYVKGAFRFFHDNQGVYKVTGYGALSGEKYVYEPDTINGYKHTVNENCHSTCVKMLQFQSSSTQQYLDLQGVTIVEPPYHSFVVYGDEASFQMRVENYKQVGSWYWQTDGVELYSGSSMNNTFFHSNDDVLKVYHSNTNITNSVIWKNENGPVIQWGWSPRNLENVHVKDTYVIHNKMYWADVKTNTCVLNASPHWSSTGTADPNTLIKDLFFENIYVEGKTNCAIRLYALSNTENIHIKNLFIEEWNDLDPAAQVSVFTKMDDALAIGNETFDGKGLKLENYWVAGEYISKEGANWQAESTGRLGFDSELWDNWNAWSACSTVTPTADSGMDMWVAGSFSNWSLLSMTEVNAAFELELPLSPGDYSLKFANSSDWSGQDWGDATGLSGTAQETTGGAPNITFTIAQNGTYAICFDPNTLNYSIELTP